VPVNVEHRQQVRVARIQAGTEEPRRGAHNIAARPTVALPLLWSQHGDGEPGAQSPAAARLSAAPRCEAGRGQPLACVVHRPGWIDLKQDLWQLNLGVHARYGLRCNLMGASRRL